MDRTGYNCAEINELRGAINTTAMNAGEGIVEIMKNDIIIPMSTVWYAPEAVEFFAGLASAVASTGQGITDAFDSFRQAVQDAGAMWAENTGGEVPSLSPIDLVELTLDTSAIQDNDAGNVYILEAEATSIAGNLQDVEVNIKTKLQELAAQLNAETAFLGHGQASAITTCFETLGGAISQIFAYLSQGEDSLQGQINRAAQKYQDVSTGISGAFNQNS